MNVPPKPLRVTFQGEPGAYANLAAREALPQAMALPRATFEYALAAVGDGDADLTIIPVENSLHGRIADIHHLLPEAGLHIVGEHFHRVRHQLLGVKGAGIADVKTVFSQEPALGQCRKLIRERHLVARTWHDTAGQRAMSQSLRIRRSPPSLRHWRASSTGSKLSRGMWKTKRTM